MFIHPALLLRRAQSHPHNVRLRPFDRFDDFAIFLLRQPAKRRAVRPRHLHPPEPRHKSRRQLPPHSRHSSIKEVPVPFLPRPSAHGLPQLRPTHPPPHPHSIPPPNPPHPPS